MSLSTGTPSTDMMLISATDSANAAVAATRGQGIDDEAEVTIAW
jgi:hypothetical protein